MKFIITPNKYLLLTLFLATSLILTACGTEESIIEVGAPTSVAAGESFEISVEVIGNETDIPTGGVTVTGAVSCSITLDSTGKGSCSVSIADANPAAEITLTYFGDKVYKTQEITIEVTGTEVGATEPPQTEEPATDDTPEPPMATLIVTYSEPVSSTVPFEVSVQVVGNKEEIPTGTVIVDADPECEQPITLDGEGKGSCLAVFEAARSTARLDVSFSSDGVYPDVQESFQVLVQDDSRTTFQYINPSPNENGQAVRIFVKVDNPHDRGFAPTGTVNVLGAGFNCSFSFDLADYDKDATASGGDGTGASGNGYIGYCDGFPTPVGEHSLTATFVSDFGRNVGAYLTSSDTIAHNVICASGYVYDDSQDSCVLEVTTCDVGFVFSEGEGGCVEDPTYCSEGFEYSEGEGGCVEEATSCQEGYQYDEGEGGCVEIPQ